MSLELIERLGATTPILGVCLGHQSIGQAYGGEVIRAQDIMHGKTSRIRHEGKGVFAGLPDALRGHALPLAGGGARHRCPTASRSPPGPRTRTAPSTRSWACATATLPVEGVQFHPESILTEHGHALLKNFLQKPHERTGDPPRFRAGMTQKRSAFTNHDHESRPTLRTNDRHPITSHAHHPQEALQRTIEHREIFHDEMVDLMRQIMRGEVSPADDRGDPDRPAGQEGNRRRDRRRGAR